MKGLLKASLKRFERLAELHRTYVAVAEAGVKQAQGEVQRLEAVDHEVAGNIRHTQAGMAYLKTAAGHDLHRRERYLQALEKQRKLVQLSLETANSNLEQRRREWTEAMREQKIAAKLQERRLHQRKREADAAQQKSQDDASIARYVRTRLEK